MYFDYFDELNELLRGHAEKGAVLDYVKIQVGFKGQRYAISLLPLLGEPGEIRGQLIFDNAPVEAPDIAAADLGDRLLWRSPTQGQNRISLGASGGQLRIEWLGPETDREQ